MTRHLYILIASLFAVLYTPSIVAQCNTVDAVTTASFKITGGQACSTYADLNWTFNENNGTMTIRWGTSTSYGAQKSVYTSKPIKLTGLTPKTTYYYAVDGVYEGRTHQYTRSSFSTSAGAVAVNKPPVITSASSVVCTTGTTKTYTATATDADNNPVTFSATGLPGWITFANPTLTLKPVDGSGNDTVTLTASDGKGGLDTLPLTITVIGKTGIAGAVGNETGAARLVAGKNCIVLPVKNGQMVTIELFALNGSRIGSEIILSATNGTVGSGLVRKTGNGMYLLRASWAGGSAQQKMVIDK